MTTKIAIQIFVITTTTQVQEMKITQEQKSVHRAIITKVFGNNGKFLPQSPFPLRHPKKNHPVTLCHLGSRLHQEPLFPPKSIMNVGGLAGLQLLSSFRHLLESVPPGLCSQAPLATVGRPVGDNGQPPRLGEERTNCLFCFLTFQKSSPRIPCALRASGSVQHSNQ